YRLQPQLAEVKNQTTVSSGFLEKSTRYCGGVPEIAPDRALPEATWNVRFPLNIRFRTASSSRADAESHRRVPVGRKIYKRETHSRAWGDTAGGF
ncbi:MAG: hypothetical protein OIN84_16865, partial [Candidatus Methanoperedens sp.]|nr:hypothetical protein [Candidatus Methanoperedens sp.]